MHRGRAPEERGPLARGLRGSLLGIRVGGPGGPPYIRARYSQGKGGPLARAWQKPPPVFMHFPGLEGHGDRPEVMRRVPTVSCNRLLYVVMKLIRWSTFALPGILALAWFAPACGNKEKMEVKKQAYGTMPDGTAVDLYTLTNANGMQAGIITYGGALVQLTAPDRTERCLEIGWPAGLTGRERAGIRGRFDGSARVLLSPEYSLP